MKILAAITVALSASATAYAIPAASSEVIKSVFASKDFATIMADRKFGSELEVKTKAISYREKQYQYAYELCQDAGSLSRSGTVIEVKFTTPIYTVPAAGTTLTSANNSLITYSTETFYFATPGAADNVAACSLEGISKAK